MYLIASGEVEVVVPDETVRLAAGDFFGEASVLKRRRRGVTVRAATPAGCSFSMPTISTGSSPPIRPWRSTSTRWPVPRRAQGRLRSGRDPTGHRPILVDTGKLAVIFDRG